MDHKLIKALLTELLQLPEPRCTPEKLLSNLTLAATAAGVSLTSAAAPLQVEHLQLAAALERLATELGAPYRGRAMLRLGAGLEGVELGAVIEPNESSSTLPRFVAFGSTAREALGGIQREIRATAPTRKPATGKRKAGVLSLKRLAEQTAGHAA